MASKRKSAPKQTGGTVAAEISSGLGVVVAIVAAFFGDWRRGLAIGGVVLGVGIIWLRVRILHWRRLMLGAMALAVAAIVVGFLAMAASHPKPAKPVGSVRVNAAFNYAGLSATGDVLELPKMMSYDSLNQVEKRSVDVGPEDVQVTITAGAQHVVITDVQIVDRTAAELAPTGTLLDDSPEGEYPDVNMAVNVAAPAPVVRAYSASAKGISLGPPIFQGHNVRLQPGDSDVLDVLAMSRGARCITWRLRLDMVIDGTPRAWSLGSSGPNGSAIKSCPLFGRYHRAYRFPGVPEADPIAPSDVLSLARSLSYAEAGR